MISQIMVSYLGLTIASFILIYILYKKPKGNLAILFLLLLLTFIGINISEILILKFVYTETLARIMYSLVIISIAFFMHFTLTFEGREYVNKLEMQVLIYILPSMLIFLTLFTKVVIIEVDYVYIRGVRTSISIFLNVYGLGLLFLYSFLYTISASSFLLWRWVVKEEFPSRKKQIKFVFLGTIPFAFAYSISFSILKLFTKDFTPHELILIDLITHIAVIITYILFSYVVITKILIIVPQKEKVIREDFVKEIAYCGIDCNKCGSFKNGKCFGCREANKGEIICNIYACIENKNIENCLRCFKLENCDTFLKTIPKRPGRTFEKIEEGTYIIKEELANYGYELFRIYLMHGGSGYCLSRMHPSKIREKYKLIETPIVWLSVTPDPNEKIITVNPTDIASIITTIKQFLEDTKSEGIILIDGIEYLIIHNGAEIVAKMIQTLHETAVMSKAKILITLNPKAIDEKVMRVLERELKIIDKMPKKFRCNNCKITFFSVDGVCSKCKKRGIEIGGVRYGRKSIED